MGWTAGVTRTTGDLITAANWNTYLGANGSLDYVYAALDDCSWSEPSRVLETDYTNGSKIRIVTVTVEVDDGDRASARIGASSPTDVVAYVYNALGVSDVRSPMTFVVPPGWKYDVTASNGTPTILEWHEWDLL